MGFPAKGAFALTFLFKSSLRGCLRVFFLQTSVGGFWNVDFNPCQKMKKRKKTMRTMKTLILYLPEQHFGAAACPLSSEGGQQHEKAKPPQK